MYTAKVGGSPWWAPPFWAGCERLCRACSTAGEMERDCQSERCEVRQPCHPPCALPACADRHGAARRGAPHSCPAHQTCLGNHRATGRAIFNPVRRILSSAELKNRGPADVSGIIRQATPDYWAAGACRMAAPPINCQEGPGYQAAPPITGQQAPATRQRYPSGMQAAGAAPQPYMPKPHGVAIYMPSLHPQVVSMLEGVREAMTGMKCTAPNRPSPAFTALHQLHRPSPDSTEGKLLVCTSQLFLDLF